MDEVPMLDAELLSKLDCVGRAARNNPGVPFGGFQLGNIDNSLVNGSRGVIKGFVSKNTDELLQPFKHQNTAGEQIYDRAHNLPSATSATTCGSDTVTKGHTTPSFECLWWLSTTGKQSPWQGR